MHPCRLLTLVRLLAATAALAALAALACRPPERAVTTTSGPPAAPAKRVQQLTLQAAGLDPSAMDRRVDPCTDFYAFACGGWLKSTRIPADKPSWSRSFEEISQRNEADLREILERAAQHPSGSPEQQKIGTFYRACMDEAQIERDGIKPMQELFTLVDKVRDRASLSHVLGKLHRHQLWAFFDISAEQDFKDVTQMIAFLDQNGLGLPDRDYYLEKDERSASLRGLYRAHLVKMLELAGYRPPAAQRAAERIFTLETELAKISKTRVERRDLQRFYNRIDRPGLVAQAPAIDWDAYFNELDQAALVAISVTSVEFFAGMSKLVQATDQRLLRDYLKWQIIHRLAPELSKAIVEENFRLTQALTGQPTDRPRWKRCVEGADSALGEILGQAFVAKRFSEGSKRSAEAMVHAISRSFSQAVQQLDWMDAGTKARAKEKLDTVAYMIGYPARWKRYEFALAGHHAANVLAAQAFALDDKLRKIGKPVDRTEWGMTPQTVNAYYNPLRNQMVFSAGILQPPFFQAAFHMAVNLGAIGMVVGHELTHGFDDQGARFDARGNMRGWWVPETEQRFKGKHQCLISQYDKYEVLPGVRLNGKLTLGENIADLAGIKLAHLALQAHKAESPVTTVAEGFSEDQLLFLALGQVWCNAQREDFTRLLAKLDVHSNPRFRVNGPLSNYPPFAEAFSCRPGTPMRPAHPCTVW